MANSGSGSRGIGCGTLIAVVVFLSVLVAVIGAIAEAFTNLAIWMEDGSEGLPPLAPRDSAYPLAWGLFLAVVAVMVLAGGAAAYELKRRRAFREFAARAEKPGPDL